MAIKQVSAHYFWLAFPKLRIFLLHFHNKNYEIHIKLDFQLKKQMRIIRHCSKIRGDLLK